jgi:hypothetical protein
MFAVLYPQLLFVLTCCLVVMVLSGGYVASAQVLHAQYRRGILGAFSCRSASLTGSGSDQCTVTLATAAGSRGYTVRLASNNAMVAVPATVVVPAGATNAGFTASVASVTSAQTVTLTASANGVSESFALQLNAAAAATVPTLSVSPTSVAFGNVTVNTAAELPVTLSSTGTAPVIINSATLTGSVFKLSGATFPVTLNPSLAVTLEVQFDPTAAAAETGQLTFQSNSSTDSTVAISVSGTGEAVLQHQVDLSWVAPSSSPVQITGYNIYRAPGGSTSYQQLNSSVVTQTTYLDSTVQAGSSYDYYVESVDSSGAQSAPSNQVAASVP